MSDGISVRFSKTIAPAVLVSKAQAISTAALIQGIPSLAPMLEQVTPAVVSIRVSKAITAPGHLYAIGAGSGVIVDAAKGLIITNHHVIADASQITVRLCDERMLKARLLGSDPGTDVALLQVEAEYLIEIGFADITTVAVGDYAVAIGNPFDIGQTVTSGIISALGRAGTNNANYEDFIQTDAAINLGNSGGALVDMEGNLIGINTAIISDSGGSNGIGFAVPVDMVASVMEHLKRDGKVKRGLLGVAVAGVTPNIVTALELNVDYGAVVTDISPNSAVEKAGVQLSDVIVEINGKMVRGSRQLRNIIGLLRQDQNAELVLYRSVTGKSVQARIGGSVGRAVMGNSAVKIPARD